MLRSIPNPQHACPKYACPPACLVTRHYPSPRIMRSVTQHAPQGARAALRHPSHQDAAAPASRRAAPRPARAPRSAPITPRRGRAAAAPARRQAAPRPATLNPTAHHTSMRASSSGPNTASGSAASSTRAARAPTRGTRRSAHIAQCLMPCATPHARLSPSATSRKRLRRWCLAPAARI